MDTVIRSRSRTLVIGSEQPFCVIGERINPTGRKAFQAQLQAGDLSQLELDVAQQVEGGANMLDVNVGDPLADEVGLMAQAIPLVQGLTDIPLCIDSSVIEALEAGLDAYEGKALVNSVTGEDERLEAILPIVARHGVPRGRAEPRAHERDHGREAPRDGRSGQGDGLPPRPRRVGRDLDPHVQGEAGRERVSALEDIPDAPHPERVRMRFLQVGEDRAVKEARVLAGTTIFDAASWNGVAIDSTCGGHGTCKKCKVKVVSGHAPLSAVDPRAFSTEELKNGWRLACRAAVEEDLTIEVPPLQTRPKAALVGVGRHVILRPAVQKRYVELDEATLEDQTSDLERLLAAMDDIEPRVPLEVVRELGHTLRE